jgi:hypothetical protein
MGLVMPPAAFTRQETNTTVPSTAGGTVVTASSTIHTKGAYAELITATAFDTCYVEILMSGASVAATATSILVDIAIGAAASETDIISNLNAGGASIFSTANTSTGGQKYAFPLYIPAGSRVSARCQALISSDTVNVAIRLLGGPTSPVWAGQQVTTYGANIGTSLGVSVAQGISDAEGTFTEITSATTAPMSWLSWGVGTAADTTIIGGTALIDVGVGSATETVVMENFMYGQGNSEAIGFVGFAGVPVSVPTGQRLAARLSRDTGGGAEAHDVILYGVS